MDIRNRLEEGARQLDVTLTETQLDLLMDYLAMIQKWNKAYNLVGTSNANELIQSSTLEIPLLIDQGGDDPFLEKELNFELFCKTCEKQNQKLTARLQSGYDHSYYFIATFMEDHIQHHSKALLA